jgi:arrestin-related trafficking adapter 4/5/7
VIGTPHKAIVLGTSVQVNFRLVSLLKGLRIGLVATEVIETREFTIEAEGSSSRKSRKDTKSIVRDTYRVDEGGDPEIIDEEAEGYRFSRYLELPKTLKTCLQDVDIYGIKIRHKLKFNIALHNPDGHISELRATLPICLYISPALPINDENDLVDQSPVASRQALAQDMMNAAPPLYGQHEFDHLYSEVDPSGYGTPGNFSTPGTPFGSHSRNISAEDLASLEAITGGGNTNGTVTPGGSHVSALALQYRLQNLRVSGSGTSSSPLATEDHNSDHDSEGDASRRPSAAPSYSASNDYFSQRSNSSPRPASHRNQTDLSPDYGNAVNGHAPSPHQNNLDSTPNSVPNGDSSGPSSTELSRHPSGEYQSGNYTYSGTRTALPRFHHTEDLARIPSYGMALRTPARTTYSGIDLPSYCAAMSSSTAPIPVAPPVVHLRASQATGGY